MERIKSDLPSLALINTIRLNLIALGSISTNNLFSVVLIRLGTSSRTTFPATIGDSTEDISTDLKSFCKLPRPNKNTKGARGSSLSFSSVMVTSFSVGI